MAQDIIFATSNKAKLSQLDFVVRHYKFPVRIINGAEAFGDAAAYEEVGDKVERVALNGALEVVGALRYPVITEDTDLRIEALGGAPGIRAGAFLKQYGRQGILKRMSKALNRKAYISSAVAYAAPDGFSTVFANKVRGVISYNEKFDYHPNWISPAYDHPYGGGYNAIFIPDGWNKTLAQISPFEALPWSYRERNFIDLLEFLSRTKRGW